ncbi:MAG: M16 family metallopeptidase [Alphaproteobacteria bacterium]
MKIVNKKRALFNILVLFAAIMAFLYLYQARRFDADGILKNSILKEKTFSGNVVEISSPKGVNAYLMRDTTNPIISISFIFEKAGISFEEKGQKGMSNLVASMLTQGAGKLNNQAFKDELEKKAIGISFDANMDDFSGNLITTKENQNRAYELLNLVFSKPLFDDGELFLSKQQMLFALKRQTETPRGKLGLKFKEDVFVGHPYANNSVGEYEDIIKISKKDMQKFVTEKLVLENLIVGISGDITEAEASIVLDKIFGNLGSKGKVKDIPQTELLFDGRDIKVEAKSAQTFAIFANEAVERKDIDFYPLYVVNHIFGGAGLNSRLSLKARENEGLTYGIYTYISQKDKSNMLKGSFSSTPENYARVVEIVKEEWAKMGKNGISEKELKSAKNYLISSYNLRFASIDGISSMLAYMQKYDLGIDFLKKRNEYVENVDLESANRVARKYYDNENTIWYSIGNFSVKKN